MADATEVKAEEERRRNVRGGAERARKEAEARRAAASTASPAREVDGRGGPDPVRYGDWEVKGIASDF